MTVNVVFDTSCLVSAALRPLSIPDQAVTLALIRCQICSSNDALTELHNVLQRQRFDSYVSLDSRLAFFEAIRAHSQMFTMPESLMTAVRGNCRDAGDDFILALAAAAHAGVIVSSDKDLLVLHPWRGIAILTPAQFLDEFGA